MATLNRKKEILTKTAFLIKEKGYNAVTMRDIAEAMGIKAASLYNHIAGKQELLSILILNLASRFTDGMETIYNQPLTPVEKLEALIGLHIQITIEQPNALAALNNDWMHLEEADQVHFIKLRDAYEQNFRTIIHQGIKEGSIKNIHPEVVLYSILSTLRTLYLWYEKRGKLEVNILKRDLSATLLHGIV